MATNKASAASTLATSYASKASEIKSSMVDGLLSSAVSDAELQKLWIAAGTNQFLSDRLSEYATRYQKTKSPPTDGATVTSDVFDLTALALAPANIGLLVEVPAFAYLVNSKSVTIRVQDSADNSSFSNVAAISAITSTGGGGVGSASSSTTVSPAPAALRRYVRLSLVADSGAGNPTATDPSVPIKFTILT